jgi:hypothetical protein
MAQQGVFSAVTETVSTLDGIATIHAIIPSILHLETFHDIQYTLS